MATTRRFRYPYDVQSALSPWKDKLGTQSFEEAVARLGERDRALEDFLIRLSNSDPIGAVSLFAGATAPTGWLILDGSAVSRTTYADLFALIGTQYGVGDGSTTFNIPNVKGRVVVGLDSADTDWDTLGETRGSKTHTLTSGEMPSHTHTQDSHNHTQNSHVHNLPEGRDGTLTNPGAFIKAGWSNNSGTATGTTATAGSTTATNIATTATNQNTGGGGAHNNIQPSIVMNYIIRAL